jgi:hypothetical protein
MDQKKRAGVSRVFQPSSDGEDGFHHRLEDETKRPKAVYTPRLLLLTASF